MSGAQRGPGFGAPEDETIIAFTGYQTLNTKPARNQIKDTELYWCHNMAPFVDGTLRATPGPGPTLYTAPDGTTINNFYLFNLSALIYAAIFCSDGRLQIAGPITPYAISTWSIVYDSSAHSILFALSFPPACATWGQTALLIATEAENPSEAGLAYYTWDGTTLTAASTSVGGRAIETYQGRVWLASVNKVFFSAPNSYTDFTVADGAGVFQSSDSFLQYAFQGLKQANGFLYTIADSSVNYISGVSTSGTPPVTTFTNLNIDSQNGASAFVSSIQLLNRNIMMANINGVQAVYGGAVQKVSDPLDGIWCLPYSLTSFGPSSAGLQQLFGNTYYVLLGNTTNLFTGATQNLVALFDGKRWFTADQGSRGIGFIAPIRSNSIFVSYAADATLTTIYQMFAVPSDGTLSRQLMSKIYPQPRVAVEKRILNFYSMMEQLSGTSALNYTLEFLDGTGNNTSVTVDQTVSSGAFAFYYGSINFAGQQVGLNFSSVGIDFVLTHVEFGTQEYSRWT